VPADASIAVTDDGLVLVTRNSAGKLLVFTRTQAGAPWVWQDISFVPPEGTPVRPPAYTTAYFGEITAWRRAGFALPVIALAASEGVLLLEPVAHTPGPTEPWTERYELRNLTLELAGSEPITGGLVSMLPHFGLRLLGGLTASGDLVLYGETAGRTPAGHVAWTYANLYDLYIRPFGVVPPNFGGGGLVAYVTPWDGLNIAGSFAGSVIVFWTAPGLTDWRVSNLTYEVGDSQQGFQDFSNIKVYQTPWGGINIVGGDNLQVYWWVPGMPTWRAAMLTRAESGLLGSAEIRSSTMTTYVTPWGGLNIAGLNVRNELIVYWWAPGMETWQRSRIDDSLGPQDRRVDRVGALESHVAPDGTFSIFSRTAFGELLRYTWSPRDPVWRTAFLNWDA
jgi:hypothetical protein